MNMNNLPGHGGERAPVDERVECVAESDAFLTRVKDVIIALPAGVLAAHINGRRVGTHRKNMPRIKSRPSPLIEPRVADDEVHAVRGAVEL